MAGGIIVPESDAHLSLLFIFALPFVCMGSQNNSLSILNDHLGACTRTYQADLSMHSCLCAGRLNYMFYLYRQISHCYFDSPEQCSVENNTCVESCSHNLYRSGYGYCVRKCVQYEPFFWTGAKNEKRCRESCPLNYYTEGFRCLPCAKECSGCQTNGTTLHACNYKCSYASYYDNCVLTCPNETIRFENACLPSNNCIHIVHEGDCVVQCPVGFYYSNSSEELSQCFPCSPQCHNGCSGPGTDQCSLCQNLRHGNHCVEECPSEDPWSYQRTCQSSCLALTVHPHQCVNSCPRNYYLLNRECVMRCTDPYLVRNNTHCLTGCGNNTYQLTKANETVCVNECSTNYLIENRKCVNACSHRKPYRHPITRVCETTCLYYLLQNRCILSCPYPLFGDKSTNRCLPKCPVDLLAYSRECLSSCPAAARLRYETSCVSDCSHASRGSNRLAFVLNNTCVGSCPSNAFLNGNVCVFKCTGRNDKLYNKTCVEACPAHASFRFPNNTCTNTCGTFVHDIDIRWGAGKTCRETCLGKYLYQRNNTCVNSCPKYTPFIFDHQCVERCPPLMFHRSNYYGRTMCVTSCGYDKIIAHNRTCSDFCPSEAPILFNRTCVNHCPKGTVPATRIVGAETEIECVHTCPWYAQYNDTSRCTRCCPSHSVSDTCTTACPKDRLEARVFNYDHDCNWIQCVQHCPETVRYKHGSECTSCCPSYSVDNRCTENCPDTTLFQTLISIKHCNWTQCVQRCPEGQISLENRCIDRKQCTKPLGIDHIGRCVKKCSNKETKHASHEKNVQFQCYQHVEYKKNAPVAVGCFVSALCGLGLLIYLLPMYHRRNLTHRNKVAPTYLEITTRPFELPHQRIGTDIFMATHDDTRPQETQGSAQVSSSSPNAAFRDSVADPDQISMDENVFQSTDEPRQFTAAYERDLEMARQEIFNQKGKEWFEEITYGERALSSETTCL